MFAIQDDVTDRIVATVADKAGVLARSMVQAVRELAAESAERTRAGAPLLGVRSRIRRPADHAELRAGARGLRLRASPTTRTSGPSSRNIYICEHSLFFNPLPDSLARALRAARRAIELDPGNQEGWEMAGARRRFYQQRRARAAGGGRIARSRLNPRNANALAWMGNILTHMPATTTAAAQLTERAMALNPAHPGLVSLRAVQPALRAAANSPRR